MASDAWAVGFVLAAHSFMVTKYVNVLGQATFLHYVGATTLPGVVPDLSRGRSIAFVHAAGSNGNAWHHQLDALAASHSPVAFDFPGHGRSAGVEGLRSVGDYADFLAALLDTLRIPSAVIAGRSMGGAIAMDFALRYPQRTQALVLIATAAKFNLPPELIGGLEAVTKGRAPRAFLTTGFSPQTVKANFGVVRESWMEQVKTDPRVRYTDTLVCQQTDLRDQISRITAPALILAGADDQTTTVADAEAIKRQIAGSRLQVIADSAHNLPTEKPKEVNAALEEFLGRLA
ncbi:MAG TPA: alpha/beta hydrolase [Candidatus Binataceae bacterium]